MKTIAERVAQLKINYPWRMGVLWGGEHIETMLITLEEAESVFAQQLREDRQETFCRILEEYQPFDQKERELFRSYMARIKHSLGEEKKI